MTPFTRTTGKAVPLVENDLNTDELAPGMGGPPRPDTTYGDELLKNRRFGPDGEKRADFVLNLPRYRNAAILVSGENFGCGSSRETAVWAMRDFGIRCVVARSFAESYRENCLRNGILPVVFDADDAEAFEACVVQDDGHGTFSADLETKEVTTPDGRVFRFDFPDAEREMLLKGLDDVGLTLDLESRIADWERQARAQSPWLQRLERQQENDR